LEKSDRPRNLEEKPRVPLLGGDAEKFSCASAGCRAAAHGARIEQRDIRPMTSQPCVFIVEILSMTTSFLITNLESNRRMHFAFPQGIVAGALQQTEFVKSFILNGVSGLRHDRGSIFIACKNGIHLNRPEPMTRLEQRKYFCHATHVKTKKFFEQIYVLILCKSVIN
jgi:hypothetical protein